MMNVHCLVQVNGNELDFAEWLDYHIALGFDAIFVFNNGKHDWLNGVCERRKEHDVVVVPGEANWTYKSDIVERFVARRKQPSWAICLSDDEFIWLEPKLYRNIKDFVFGDLDRSGATACTLYAKHISSKEPMKSRVGTQIDCFTHIRREPEGFLPPIEVCPNGGATFFRITSNKMPLASRLVPSDPTRWVDANGTRLVPEEFERYIQSKSFSPMRYRARIYKFCPRSGFEMNFAENAVPRGFDIQDLSMQEARSLLIRVPVNPETEVTFAKDIIPDAGQEPDEPRQEHDPSAEELAEQKLPVSKVRICKMILSGKYFDDILNELTKTYPDIDKEALETVFQFEREAIIQSDTSYTWLRDLLDEGKTEEEICKTMLIKPTTYTRMVKVLPVLDIPKEGEGEAEGETDADPGITLTLTESDNVEDLAAQFNESVNSNKMTQLEQQEIDAFEEERRAKKGGANKKGGKKEKKSKALKARVIDVEAGEIGAGSETPPVNTVPEPTIPDVNDFNINIVESDLISNTSTDSLLKHAADVEQKDNADA